MQVIELRNYLLEAGRTGDFLRYFEEHFLFSQRDEGMHVLGQFAVVDQPDRFVWIRAFADMAARLRGLRGFYGGHFWQARRDVANAMMREHHDVHLLRPLGPVDAVTAGASLEDRGSEPPGVLPPEAGVVVLDFLRTAPGGLARLVDVFEQEMRPALIEGGHRSSRTSSPSSHPTTIRDCRSSRTPPCSSSSLRTRIRRTTSGCEPMAVAPARSSGTGVRRRPPWYCAQPPGH